MGQEKENKLQTLRSLRLMDEPLQDRVHQHSLVSRNYIKKQIANCLPLHCRRRLAMPLLSPGELDQTLTQCAVHTKGIGIFTAIAWFI